MALCSPRGGLRSVSCCWKGGLYLFLSPCRLWSLMESTLWDPCGSFSIAWSWRRVASSVRAISWAFANVRLLPSVMHFFLTISDFVPNTSCLAWVDRVDLLDTRNSRLVWLWWGNRWVFDRFVVNSGDNIGLGYNLLAVQRVFRRASNIRRGLSSVLVFVKFPCIEKI